MKQKQLKNYLKIGSLLLGIFILLLACEKEAVDNNQEQVQKKRLQKISLNQLNNRIGNSNDFENLSKAFDINRQKPNQYNRLEQNDNSWLMTDEIAMIEKNGATYYTFRIGTNTESVDFYNLVVVFDDIGNILSSTILEYTPNENWLQDTSQPFAGEVSSKQNDIFSLDDINNLFSSRAARQCITGVSGHWECNYGNNHYEGHSQCTNGTSWDYIVTVQYGACPPELTDGDDDDYPFDTNPPSGGGGGGSGGSTNDNDDNCVPSIDNPCDEEETTIMPPRNNDNENEDCIPDFSCRPGEILDEDCQCQINLEDPCANKDLINYRVPLDVVSMLESRQQPNTMVQSSELIDSFILETIDDGWGDVNQDRFSIKIDELPYGYTPSQLFNEIRMNFTNLVVGGNVPYVTDVTLEPYSDEDGITWNSDNPVGAAMDFNTIFDTSTVYCVEYNEDEMYWIFATVTSYDHQGHFVAGVRQFGLEPNGSGGYSFYVRAADRLGGILDYIANGLSGNEEVLFTQAADKTWKNLMENTASLIQNQGGIVEEFDETKTYGARHPYNEDDCQD